MKYLKKFEMFDSEELKNFYKDVNLNPDDLVRMVNREKKNPIFVELINKLIERFPFFQSFINPEFDPNAFGLCEDPKNNFIFSWGNDEWSVILILDKMGETYGTCITYSGTGFEPDGENVVISNGPYTPGEELDNEPKSVYDDENNFELGYDPDRFVVEEYGDIRLEEVFEVIDECLIPVLIDLGLEELIEID
jgi:hypothetical protein